MEIKQEFSRCCVVVFFWRIVCIYIVYKRLIGALCGIRRLPPSHKNAIRAEVELCILEAAAKPRRKRKRSSSNEKVCAMLKKKDVVESQHRECSSVDGQERI